jgi:arylsulfatase A-like enzyme
LAALGHNPSYLFRGHKADVFDGGHHIPFIVRWPGQVAAGSRSDQIICLTDLMATAADILGAKLPETAGEDSVSFLSILRGKAEKPIREAIVHHSINGSFVIRQGNWKLVLCRDSGGWSEPRPGTAKAAALPGVQLYDLTADLGEQTNLQDKHPEIVARLTRLLEKYVADGRSTPGPGQTNTVPVDIWKTVKTKPKATAKKGA